MTDDEIQSSKKLAKAFIRIITGDRNQQDMDIDYTPAEDLLQVKIFIKNYLIDNIEQETYEIDARVRSRILSL